NPAAMRSVRPVTPHVNADPLLCSEFREGRSYANWRPRGSGDWLLIFTVGGSGRVAHGEHEQRLGPGDAVLFAPHAPQDYSTDPDAGFWHLRWAHFVPRPHWRAWLPWPEIFRGVGGLELRDQALVSVAAALERMLVAH